MKPRALFRALPPLGALAVLALGASGLLFGPGCAFVEKTAGAIADATEGTALGSVSRGISMSAESMKEFTPQQEHYIGRAVAVEILSRYKVHPDSRLQEYVSLVGHAVLAAPEPLRTHRGYRFVVLQGDEVQAVSTPGGFVFLTEGVVRRARDEDELAAVLAHEVAHVSLKHGIGAIKAATRRQALALLVQGVGEGAAQVAGARGDADQKQLAELAGVFGNAIQDITGELLEKGYSRDLEFEADKEAAKYLASSAYARAALPSYLQVLEKEGAGGKGGWTATHPAPADRISELGDLVLGDSPGRSTRRQRFLKVLGDG
ncbi:MAG: M48 family metalloprotease [Planctomycetes bacterium]|nr:M48 family metalloprotease [Planctomycetota bacterium]